MNTFPPMLAVMDFFYYTTCMLSGVPLLSSDAEGRAVCKLSCVEKSNVSPHQRGHPANPVPCPSRAHPLMCRIHLAFVMQY